MSNAPDLNLDLTIDLDEERVLRSERRSVKAAEVPIRLGGEVVAYVPTELPIAALSPLRRLDSEITLILRSVMTMMNQSREAQERWDATSLVVDVLAANPALPTTVVDVISEMAKELFGAEGLEKFLSKKPSTADMGALAKRLLGFYGLSLGESQPSSVSSSEEEQGAGTTSTPTSLGTTPESPSEESGSSPETPASSEPAAS